MSPCLLALLRMYFNLKRGNVLEPLNFPWRVTSLVRYTTLGYAYCLWRIGMINSKDAWWRGKLHLIIVSDRNVWLRLVLNLFQRKGFVMGGDGRRQCALLSMLFLSWHGANKFIGIGGTSPILKNSCLLSYLQI